MNNKFKKIKTIHKLIEEIKKEIQLPQGFTERKIYHAWAQEPLCTVVDTTWHNEIKIKIKNIEERLHNNHTKTSLKEIEKELLLVTKEINKTNGWNI